MPVELFVDGLEPENPDAVIWRFVELWKLRDLLTTAEIYFSRADTLADEHEGLPPEDYGRPLGFDRYDIEQIQKRNNDIGAIAQFRQAFYLNCWYLFDHETLEMWADYGNQGAAVVSSYSRLKGVLESIPDRPHLGLVRYGSSHLTGWNTIRFITTKRETFKKEREVRALLWVLNSGDGVNRHVGPGRRNTRSASLRTTKHASQGTQAQD